MVTITNIKKLMSESMLNEVFEKREDSIATVTQEEMAEIKDLLQTKKNDYENILIAMNNIPNAFAETKQQIEENINTHLETISFIHSYDNEKYYKIGFSDGIQLIVECLGGK